MASFLISYDTHRGRNYQAFYDGIDEHGGVRLLESLWAVNLNNNAGEVRDWVRGLLDDDDSIFVIKLNPKHNWGSRHLKKAATDWLNANS